MAWTLVKKLFHALCRLLSYCALNDLANFPHFFDLLSLFAIQQIPSNINSRALNTLLDYIINWPKEKEPIWTVIYNFFLPKILTKTKSTSPPIANSVIIGLYDIWHYLYLIDFLEILRQQMQDCIHDCSNYYAKTFIFVQRSGIDKLKLIDVFGKNCLIINFIFCKDDSYLPGNTKILQFMLSKLPDEFKKFVNKLP